jgi:hypothetical protein
MPTSLLIIAAALLLLTFVWLRTAGALRRRGHGASGVVSSLLGLLFLAGATLAAAAAVGVRGYRELTYEEVAATVSTEPVGRQRFRATIVLPDRRLAMYELMGDAFYVDAHILKWHPVLNLLGVHTAYELDRVAGRYEAVADERSRPRTVYALTPPRMFDLFTTARRFRLAPLVDAQYGSASFVAATRPARFQVLVSTSGLLIRPVPR